MRIIKTKYYLMSKQVKDSWGTWLDKPVVSIVTGYKAQNERCFITGEFSPTFTTISKKTVFELNDGHIKSHRPTTTNIRQALDFLDNNKFQQVFVN